MSNGVDPRLGYSASAWQRACHECDLLLIENTAPVGHRILCPRCGALLHRASKHSIGYTAAMSLAGLVLFIPANLLPLLTFSLAGYSGENALYTGVLALYREGFIWLALLVFLCSMLAPLLKLLALLFISAGSSWPPLRDYVAAALRKLEHFQQWAMLDVYMLGVLVALVKLGDLGDLGIANGIYCYAALMLCSTLAAANFDAEAIWLRLDAMSPQELPA
ncbi:paraquat-inducible protein A [Biformimicrobium ophioploci]|nr:paraquat-inducible protein A [Microbulbifer sp. NKW57]